jgi:hypothetical protein
MPVLIVSEKTPRRLLQELRDAPILPRDHDAVLERIGDVIERERHRGAPLAVERDDRGEIDVGERVTRDHEERVVEGVTDLPHRTARAERRFFDAVPEAHADRPAVAEAVLDLRREVLQRDERVVDAVPLYQVEDVSQTWLVDDRDHRLGPIDRQGPQAAPLAAGHDHGLHRLKSRRGLARGSAGAAESEDALEIVARVHAERDVRLRASDAGHLRDPASDDVGQLLVLSRAHHRDEVDVAGHRIHLGHAGDRGEILTELRKRSALRGDEDDRRDHGG